MLFSLLIVLLQGCATTLLLSQPATSTKTIQSVFAHDVIRAIGYPKGNSENIGGLVLLGDNFSYLLTEGDKKIELIVSELNPKYLNMEDETTLVKKGNNFSGRLNFKYDSNGEEYSAKETNALRSLCNERAEPGKWFGFGQHVFYECRVNVSGSLFASEKSTFSESTKIKEGRRVVLVVNEGTKTSVDAEKVADKLLALPVTVVFDLVTLPLQLLFLTEQH